MIEYAKQWRTERNASFKISVELEKPRLEQEILSSSVDVLFVGKDYARFKGYTSAQEAIERIKPTVKPG